jgi:hypothetical protein
MEFAILYNHCISAAIRVWESRTLDGTIAFAIVVRNIAYFFLIFLYMLGILYKTGSRRPEAFSKIVRQKSRYSLNRYYNIWRDRSKRNRGRIGSIGSREKRK